MDKVVFVLGSSYCGSTLLSMLFNHVPELGSPGEAHWLMDDPLIPCSVHGADCRLTGGLEREGLHAGNLYDRVSDLLEAQHLVVTDKWSGHATRLMDHVPKERRLAILLYKKPEAGVWSLRRHNARGTVEEAVELYCVTYEHLLQFAYGGFFQSCLTISYDRLVSNSCETVSDICARYGIGVPAFTPDLRPVDWHNIGGNPATHKDPCYGQQAVVPDDRWRMGLSTADQVAISCAGRAVAVFKSLQAVTLV